MLGLRLTSSEAMNTWIELDPWSCLTDEVSLSGSFRRTVPIILGVAPGLYRSIYP
jgi:hypothetical protein